MISDSRLDALLSDSGQIPFGHLADSRRSGDLRGVALCRPSRPAFHLCPTGAAILALPSDGPRGGRPTCSNTSVFVRFKLTMAPQSTITTARRHRVKLRTESSVSSTVAALAIAAHEVGHAEQFATGYWAARATQCLLILLVLGGGVLFVYPFAAVIGGTGEVNLTLLVAVLAIFP